MESFIIEGGHPLEGTITPQGAKNEALQVISATLLTSDPVRITNIPDILDVNNLIRLLQDIGVKVTKHSATTTPSRPTTSTSTTSTAATSSRNARRCAVRC